MSQRVAESVAPADFQIFALLRRVRFCTILKRRLRFSIVKVRARVCQAPIRNSKFKNNAGRPERGARFESWGGE